MVVSQELLQGLSQMVWAEEHEPVEALALDRLNEAFGERIHVRGAVRRGYDFDAGVAENAGELLGELGVAVEDHEPHVAQEAIDSVREVACNLRHEGRRPGSW